MPGMSTKRLYANGWFWGWTVIAFLLGIVVGFLACVFVGIVLTAMTSYAQ
jgi:hypothetical protein